MCTSSEEVCFLSMDGLGLGPLILSKGKCEDFMKCLLARPFVASLGTLNGIIDFAAQSLENQEVLNVPLISSENSSPSLHNHFFSGAIKRASTEPRKTNFSPWDGGRYQLMRILRPASKHWPCQVETHWDEVLGSRVGVKRFPSKYICDSPEDFRNSNAKNPWQEILFLEQMHLNGSAQKHASLECNGIFYDSPTGDVLLVCKKVPEGDVFEFCQNLGPPGPEREYSALLVLEAVLRAVQELHNMGIAHGNIRAETVWLHSIGHCQYEALLFDMSVGSSDFLPGKNISDAVYRGPEFSKPVTAKRELQDWVAADLFACGVLGFALAMGRYPWFSTAPGACKAFEFARTQGMAKFLSSFNCSSSKRGAMSAKYRAILAQLLDLDPSERQAPSCDDPL